MVVMFFRLEMKVFKEENGPQPMVLSKDFTLSMHEKSTLRKFLGDWRGKAFTDEEAKSFDITKLLGAECQISVSHQVSDKDGKTYANVKSAVMPPPGQPAPLIPADFVRHDHKPENAAAAQAANPAPAHEQVPDGDGSPLPF